MASEDEENLTYLIAASLKALCNCCVDIRMLIELSIFLLLNIEKQFLIFGTSFYSTIKKQHTITKNS